MRQLIDLLNTSDAESILLEPGLEYDPDELVFASEEIIKEWHKLKGSNEYENFFRDKDRWLMKANEAMALEVIITSFDYGFDHIAQSLIKEYGYSKKLDLKQAQRKLKLLNNWFRLYKEKHPEPKEEEEEEKIIWEYLKADAEYALKHQIDYNCTVLEWLGHEIVIKRLEEARRKALQNGKED